MIGFIADIHGNIEALDAVLDTLADCQRIVCVGDIVGYGPAPNECCERVREMCSLALSGNHDRAAVDAYSLEWFNPIARRAAVWTGAQLTDDNRQWLRSLPSDAVADGFAVAHASLRRPLDEYVTDPWIAMRSFECMQVPLAFLGHTHLAEVYYRGPNHLQCVQRRFPSGGELALERETKYLVNFGSVGQPRDGNPAAASGVYDPSTSRLTFCRTEYDIDATVDRMRTADLPQALRERLYDGW